jgi:hypothetical protein
MERLEPAEGVISTTIVHVDVAKTLIAMNLQIEELTKMVFNLNVKIQLLLDDKQQSGKTVEGIAATECDWDFPITSQALMEQLESKLPSDLALKSKLKAALSLAGGNKSLRSVIRGVMKTLMAKELRMRYVARKKTKDKFVFTSLKVTCAFVMGKSLIKNYLLFHLYKISIFVGIIRSRLEGKGCDLSDEAILKEMGPTAFTSAADEDGGVEKRKILTAVKRAAVKKYNEEKNQIDEQVD